MSLHTFIVMPFGTKEGIDFNRVYADYIKPALTDAGFEVFRADEELLPGDIRSDMFQELLIADLVVADLSIDNPNVWYELGVRHGLRARGVIQVRHTQGRIAFDLCTDRTLHYHVKDGAPDPEMLAQDKEQLTRVAKEIVASGHTRKFSPVYRYLGFLEEPEWKDLRVDGAKEFWDRHDAWALRIEVARKKDLPGDILVLADEAPTQALRIEAHRRVAKALRGLGQFALALEQVETALATTPGDLTARQEKGMLLGRLGKRDEAKEWLKAAVNDHPQNAETRALLGRVEKDIWVEAWRRSGRTLEEMRADAKDEDAQLREAAETYASGFRADPRHYYSGINAVTLLHLDRHLTGSDGQASERLAMEGGVRWATMSALEKDAKDYYARVTLADLEALVGDRPAIENAYKEAVAVAEKDWFNLDSTRQQLLLMQDLGFRPAEVAAAVAILDRALDKLRRPDRWEPRQVILFSGHMIDAPDRKEPRFPAEKEPIAARRIAEALDALGAGSGDLALCQAAAGGDLLFLEACQQRGVRCDVLLPFPEPEFIEHSVLPSAGGEKWRARYYAVTRRLGGAMRIMPEELGPLPKSVDPFERCNLWLLYTALAHGVEKVRFICLWNRKGGEGPGGTHHMHDAVKSRSGQVQVLDTNLLW